MYKNNLLDNLKILDFFQRNLSDLKSISLSNLSPENLKFIAENLNANMEWVIRNNLFDILIQNKSTFNRLINDETGLYIEIIDKSYDIEEINQVLEVDIEILRTVYENRKITWGYSTITLKDTLFYCIDNNITDIKTIENISQFIKKHDFSYLGIRTAEALKILDFVVEFECFDFDIELIQRMMNSAYDFIGDFKKILLELAPVNKLGIQFNLFDLADKTDLLEKFKVLKEIILYVADMKKNGVSLIEREEHWVTYVTNICECNVDKSLANVAFVAGTFLEKDFTTKELNTFLYKLKENNTFTILANHSERLNGFLRYIYPNYKYLEHIQGNFMFKHYILSNKKTKFIHTLSEMSDYEFKGGLFKQCVYERLNLNNLTQKDIKTIDSLNNLRFFEMLHLSKYSNIERDQFLDMLKFTQFQVRMFNNLECDSLTKKIGIIKNFAGHINMSYLTSKYDITEMELITLFEEKGLKERVFEIIEPHKMSFNAATTTQWIELLLLDCSDELKKQIKVPSDIDFLVNRLDDIIASPTQNLEELKRSLFKSSEELRSFIDDLNLSQDFVKENFESIYNFYNRGCIDIYNHYISGITSATIKRNFNKITKAELVGKLDQVKFYPGDLSLEANISIDNTLEEKWKENISVHINKYKIMEDYSYETCMKIGQVPVTTCLSYISGMYKSCLLSSFDATKKLLVMKNEDDQIISRAYIRLTKMSSKRYKTVNNTELLFRDITEENNVSDLDERNEEVVLFLEKNYTYLNEIDEVTDAMIQAAYQKAKAMGVKLVIAHYYGEKRVSRLFKDDLSVFQSKYIYIAKSKNSKQYLDSFSGELRAGEEKYIEVKNCMVV